MSVESTRWSVMVDGVARRALAQAEEQVAHADRSGEVRVGLVSAVPLCEALLDADVEGAKREAVSLLDRVASARESVGESGVRFADGRGHSRGLYGALLGRLVGLGLGHHPAEAGWPEVGGGGGAGGGDVSEVLWGQVNAEAVDGAVVDGVVGSPGKDGALHHLGLDDLLDAWTYRELAGLHALDLLARREGCDAWATAAARVAVFHQVHTQPDYTTYQPWGLAAFASVAETGWFAEQQLHDVETHLAVEGGPGAAVVALLLTDAALTLRGAAGQTEGDG
ncbi:MAG: hypothetical protein AAGI68_15645 [Planctomycetota bacterium]